MSTVKIAACLACSAMLPACLFESGEPDHPNPGAGPALVAAMNPASAALLPSHLPCEIETLVRTRCKSCHAPMSPLHQVSLLTYADFIQPAPGAPGLNYAQRALQLVQSGMMPPTSSLDAADIQTFGAWVQAGAPAAECSGATVGPGGDAGTVIGFDAAVVDAGLVDAGFNPGPIDAGTDALVADAALDGGNPYDTPSRCTSNQRWLGGDMRSELMHPGRACIDCHTTGTGLFNLLHGPSFTLAGTIFPSAHEPDECNGAAGSGVSVVVKGADGQQVTMTPNAVGNFHAATRVAMPYTVEVRYQGRVRAMSTPQMVGDCNSCHNERGSNGAPGRIVMP